MKSSIIGSALVSFVFSFIFSFHSYSLSNEKETNKTSYQSVEEYTVPTAINDTFEVVHGCTIQILTGNVLINDVYPEDVKVKIGRVVAPKTGILSFGTKGSFIYHAQRNILGEIKFSYRLCHAEYDSIFSDAEVIVNVVNDYDCDGVADYIDLDDDSDGIPDSVEGIDLDTDKDGIVNSLDIDSDNDGIPDNIEWQSESNYKFSAICDLNCNGWDDIYDSEFANNYYAPIDTDGNGIPDFLDTDSDGDNISDMVESCDMNNDGIADFQFLFSDFDFDGLDDGCDTVKSWDCKTNVIGSIVCLPDHNNNGIRDWREKKAEIIEPENLNPITPLDTVFSFYPNPCTEYLNIHIPFPKEDDQYILSVVNINGKIERKEEYYKSPIRTNLGTLDSGVKILILQTPERIYTEKFILK